MTRNSAKKHNLFIKMMYVDGGNAIELMTLWVEDIVREPSGQWLEITQPHRLYQIFSTALEHFQKVARLKIGMAFRGNG